VIKAHPLEQVRLLDVQALDTRQRQLAHRRKSLPEHQQLSALEGERDGLRDQLVQARTLVSDIERELRKSEADVEQVRSRADRDQARLDAGTGSAKDLQALQHEMVSLARRQSELEDVELEVMERLEQAQSKVLRLQGSLDEGATAVAALTASRDEAVTKIDAEAASATAERNRIAEGLDTSLVTLYEKIRTSSDGLGAAPLKGRSCEGCRMQLTPSDLGRIRSAPQDEVLRCDECRCILVRTLDSDS